jgi:hypothetical protein
MDPRRALTGNQVPAFFCLAAIVANHSLFRLGEMSWAWAVTIVVVISLIAGLAPQLEFPGRIPRINRWNVAIGMVALLPVAASLLLGWNREFPFSGDQELHVKQAYYLGYWWALPPATPPTGLAGRMLSIDTIHALLARPWQMLWSRAALMAVLIAGTGYAYRRSPRAALVFATAAFVGWGLFERTIYLRYPGAGYLLDLPFLGPAYLLGDIDLAGRIRNVLSVAVWLFLLRPLLLRRWPDAAILPVVALLFWQKDVLYYFDSTYLEPWAVIFALLAVEMLILRGRQGAPLACLMIGWATAFKEPLVLALPLIWLASIVPWTSLRDTIRASAMALAAGFPFVVYFSARENLPDADMVVGRAFKFTGSAQQFLFYAQEYAHRMVEAYAGLDAVVAVAAIVLLPILLWRGTPERRILLILIAGGFVSILLFAFDVTSQSWPGYFRFFLCSLPFFAAGVFALGHILTVRSAFAVGVAALALQAPSAWTAVARSAGPGSARNFVEHYEAPLVFPMKWLLAEARRSGMLKPDEIVIANQPDDTARSVPGINVEFGPLGDLQCQCTGERPQVMALFVRFANLNASLADGANPRVYYFGLLPERESLWRANRAARPACLAEMRQTCKKVIERIEGGEVVGAIGSR